MIILIDKNTFMAHRSMTTLSPLRSLGVSCWKESREGEEVGAYRLLSGNLRAAEISF